MVGPHLDWSRDKWFPTDGKFDREGISDAVSAAILLLWEASAVVDARS